MHFACCPVLAVREQTLCRYPKLRQAAFIVNPKGGSKNSHVRPSQFSTHALSEARQRSIIELLRSARAAEVM